MDKLKLEDPILKDFIKIFPTLNLDQKKAIIHTEGPLLIIAGPGTGKTLVLILRTLYLILSKKAKPSEIILTTFTEKAAFELRDRISQIAKMLNLKLPLYEIKIGTLHGICNEIITDYLIYTPLKNNYIILDDLTQFFFIYENFDSIIGNPENDKYCGRWKSKWTTIKNIVPFFNKISEELINTRELIDSDNLFVKKLGNCYNEYRKLLIKNNKIDFANLQSLVHEILHKPEVSKKVKSKIKYLMIDEYQDTNYIQEQIILFLSKPKNNICVVGDEDQSIYRFRGATVRNILEFPKHFKQQISTIKLLFNYRSHPDIIKSYNKFMKSIDWNSKSNRIYRFPDKLIKPPPNEKFPKYPSIFCIWGSNQKDEATRFAQMIYFFKKNKVIQDYSDVALLLRSVRLKFSKKYMDALENLNIPFFCPRAKSYFENKEIKLIMACFALIFGFFDEYLQEYRNKEFINEGLILIQKYYNNPLRDFIRRKRDQINNLRRGESLDLNIIDIFYQILAYSPFSDFINDEQRSRNISTFSKILNVFQIYYQVSIITYSNKDYIKFILFNSFFNFLIDGGMDEYEDPDNPIPKGFVQIMTIHQSKGLEFPITIVGSLDKNFRTQKIVDKFLSKYYSRGLYEPVSRITDFDRARHFYVAFSRAQKILILITSTQPHPSFLSIWEGLDQWPYVQQDTLKAQKFISKSQFIPKKSYSLTSHINLYDTCPRQYLFFKEYDYHPSRTGQVIFGLLVHQTIEEIHRYVLDDKTSQLNQLKIEKLFNENYEALLKMGLRPLAPNIKESALKQILNYFYQNNEIFSKIKDTEIEVSIEKNNYILLGIIDLIIEDNEELEIIDFKTQKKPLNTDPILEKYRKQLSIYAYILKERYGREPKKLKLYWTSEEKRKDSIVEFDYDESYVKKVINEFDEIINKISNKDYNIREAPKSKICKECDLRFVCLKEGIIK
jgi:DNA helicase-2/ATP-dependent DNA helicase PcrA